ncbi:MAG: glycosyltransferase [Pseudomonadota bacterium]
MRFYFTEEDRATSSRAADIRAALVYAGHRVIRGRVGEPPPTSVDVWMHGIGIEGSPPMTERVATLLCESPARIGIFQLCDAENMSFERIPSAVMARADLFLRNHWPRDDGLIPDQARDRTGWLPPMIKPLRARPGLALAERAGGAIFYGTRTGFANLAGGKNARDELVRLMRGANLPFRGGILGHDDPRYPVDPSLAVARMSGAQHDRLLQDAKICLSPWGNHVLTYRFFEGLARRCLVVAESIQAAAFLDGGLQAGRHYVEVKADLSDLIDQVRYYLASPVEAQRIADAGHEHFKQYFEARGRLISAYTFEASIASWGELYRRSETRSLASALRSRVAYWFPSWF